MTGKIVLIAGLIMSALFCTVKAEEVKSREVLIGKMNLQAAPIKNVDTKGVAVDKNKVQFSVQAARWKGHWNAGQFLLPEHGKIVFKIKAQDVKVDFFLQLYGGKILPPPKTKVIDEGNIVATWDTGAVKGNKLSALWLDLRSTAKQGDVEIMELAVFKTVQKNKLPADEILKTPPVHSAQLKPFNGAMTLFIDGKPITGQMWSHICYHNVNDKYLKDVICGLGYPMVAIPFAVGENRMTRLYPSSWTGEDEFDWSYIDTQAQRVLKLNPDVKIILMLAFDGAKWWTDKNPDSANPEIDREKNPRFPGPKGIPDYLSLKWKKTSREVLRQLVAHVQSSSWGKAVIGYELFNGSSMDCNFNVPHENSRFIADFRDSLKKRYKTVPALQSAWHNKNVNFNDAQPLTVIPEGLIIEPAEHQRFLDTRRLVADQFREVFTDFAAVIKDATQGKALVGARTGDFFGNYGWNDKWFKVGEDSGWLMPLLLDSNFDYFDVQEPYPGRALGDGAGVPVLPVHALYQYRKAVFIQNDVRTHLSNPNVGYGRTPDLESTIQLQRRVFVNALIYGMIPYLWQMNYLYNQPELLAEYRLQEKILCNALNKDRSSVAEVAIVFDPEVRLLIGNDKEYTAPSRYFALFDFMKHVWQRAGVPFDMIFIDQLQQMKSYKVYVFCNTWRFNDAQVKAIKDTVFKNGQTAVFLWADGLIAPDGRFNAERLSELTGIDVQSSPKSESWEMRGTEALKKLLGMNSQAELGVLEERNYDACAKNVGTWKYAPSFFVKDSNKIIALAKCKNARTAAAMRRYDDYTVIYSASANLTIPLLRLALKTSKAFEYVESDALFMMNKTYIAFHANKTETVELKLPKAVALRDLFSGRRYPASVLHLIKLEKNKTYLFERVIDAE